MDKKWLYDIWRFDPFTGSWQVPSPSFPHSQVLYEEEASSFMPPGCSCSVSHSLLFFFQGSVLLPSFTPSLSNTVSVFDLRARAWCYHQPCSGLGTPDASLIHLHQATCVVDGDAAFTVFAFGGVSFSFPRYASPARLTRRLEALEKQSVARHAVSSFVVDKRSLRAPHKHPTLNAAPALDSHVSVATSASRLSGVSGGVNGGVNGVTAVNTVEAAQEEKNDLSTLFAATDTRSVSALAEHCLTREDGCLFTLRPDPRTIFLLSPFSDSPLTAQSPASHTAFFPTSIPCYGKLPDFNAFRSDLEQVQQVQQAQQARQAQQAQLQALSPARAFDSDRYPVSPLSVLSPRDGESSGWSEEATMTRSRSGIPPPTPLPGIQENLNHTRSMSMQILTADASTPLGHTKTTSFTWSPKFASEHRLASLSQGHFNFQPFSKPVVQERAISPVEKHSDLQYAYVNSNRSSLVVPKEKHEEDNLLEMLYEDEWEKIRKAKEEISGLENEIQSLRWRVEAAMQEKSTAEGAIRLLEANARDSKYESYTLEELQAMYEEKKRVL